jgi:hypothetical protein
VAAIMAVMAERRMGISGAKPRSWLSIGGSGLSVEHCGGQISDPRIHAYGPLFSDQAILSL